MSKSNFLVVILLSLSTPALVAQIVNIEDKRRVYADTVGWFGQLDVAANWLRNTQGVLTVSSDLRIDRVAGRHQALLLTNLQMVRAADRNLLNEGFLHLRYGYRLGPDSRWTGEAFGQLQYNERIRLNLRSLLGAGLRRQLGPATQAVRCYAGLLYMYEYDEVDNGRIYYRDHRLSAYLSAHWQASQQLALANTTYYQPQLPDLRLPRISSVSTLVLTITERLKFQTRFHLTYDGLWQRDVAMVPATTFQWTNGLRYTW